MNIFVPQSLQTQIELEEIAAVERQIITPTSSQTIIGVVQDGLLGAYNLTAPTVRIDWRSAMNIISYTTIEDFSTLKKKKNYTGHELYSLILPKGLSVDRKNLKIKDGKLLEGRLVKDHLGPLKKNNLVQLMWDGYGVEATKNFIDNTQRLVNNYNLYSGFTVGLDDALISKELTKQIDIIHDTKNLKIEHLITEIENNPDIMAPDIFEMKLLSEMGSVPDEINKLVMNSFPETNGFKIMTTSGSKGGITDIGQLAGSLGLQRFDGKLVPKKYNKRTLAYFPQNDDRSRSRGLVRKPFISGIDFPGFVFHLLTSRLGVIEQAIKSVTGDTPVVVLENNKPKHVMIGDWIDNQLEQSKDKVEKYKERDMELLKLSDKTYIPTTDEDGNVTWGLITAITRHDPGLELYEIKTCGGREVIVTESKSLLIWNKENSKFEQKSTPTVEVGDFVPVTLNLSMPPNKNVYVVSDEWSINLLNEPNKIIVCWLKNYFSKHGKTSDNSIEIKSDNIEVINGVNMLLTRISIFSKLTKTSLIISDSWFNKFMNIINKNDTLYQHRTSITKQNDVVLDAIVEINKIDVAKYPKVYDLTVPSTLNFGLANGLHVVDTAETGYAQRKLIKSMEDIMVKYDGTVRTANDLLLQSVYGSSGADTTKQYEYTIRLIEMSNAEVDNKFKFTSQELKSYKNYSNEDNNKYISDLIDLRNTIRKSVRSAKLDYIVLTMTFMLPVNLNRIINNTMGSETNKKSSGILDPVYINAKLEEIISAQRTTLFCMSSKDQQNEASFKMRDDKAHKTILKASLHDALSPKKVLIDYDMNKSQFDTIVDEIISSFNKNIIEPGEFCGIIAAQSMGEPLTQFTLNSFHHAGIASVSATRQGVPRVKELLSVSKKPGTPQMIIYLTDDYKNSKEMSNKIASHIKYTTLGSIRKRINVYYDPEPKKENSIMKKDGIEHMFYKHNGTKSTCNGDINGLPWLLRIEMNKEKMLEKEVTLLEIKSKFCSWWEKRFSDSKSMKKEEKKVINKITQLAVLSNSDNDTNSIIHIRFNVKDADKEKDKFNLETINSFIDIIVDKFKLKGIGSVTDIPAILEQRIVTFNDETGEVEKKTQHVIYTAGVNMIDIRYIIGIDLLNTISNDVVEMYNVFGIEIARSILFKEIFSAYEKAGGEVNSQHISIIVDLMTASGSITSIDRFGMGKSDTDPLSRASFEKSVEQLIDAAVFGEVDHMKGISSRIMAGAVVKGGTGYCDVVLDTDMVENSQLNDDISYVTKFTELTTPNLATDIKQQQQTDGFFIPT